MAEQEVDLSAAKWLGLIIAIIALTNITILLDIPILRQVFSFLFLTFIPGLLIVFLLKLDKLGLAEKIVLSMGLSFAFLILFGLLVNGSLLAVGYTKPLSTASLLISFSAATIALAIAAYFRNKTTTLSFSSWKLTTREKAFLILPSLFPLISIIGMRIMNLTLNNALLMAVLLLIAAYVILLSFLNRRVPERIYPIVIFLVSISLLLMYSLKSNHIIGSDTHREYFIFLTTVDNLRWSQLGFGTLDTCLSISILPAIYQTFLNINPEYLFKLLPSLIVSILPLVVYLLSKKYIGGFYAFLASVFLMSQVVFLWTPAYARVNIAIFFFGLMVLAVFHDGISEFGKKSLFMIFAVSTIVSHYGVTYIAFFALLITWIGMQILPRFISRQKEAEAKPGASPVINKDPPTPPSQRGSPPASDAPTDRHPAPEPAKAQLSRGITIPLLALFMVMLFFWYSQMTGTTFSIGVRFAYASFADWQWFLTGEIAEQPVRAAFGKTLPYAEISQKIEFIFSWLTIFLMSVGFLAMLLRFRALLSTPGSGHRKQNFLLKNFELEYLILSGACFLTLAVMVVLPYVSMWYGSARTYLQMVIPLSVFFVIGGIVVARYLKSRPYWVILVVLIPFFLSTTGAVGQLFSYQRPGALTSGGIYDAESYAAKWAKEYSEKGVTFYSYGNGIDVLLSQGKIPGYGITGSRLHGFKEGRKIDGYIFLRYLDIIDEGLVTQYPDMFSGKSKIYSNGRSEMYR